MLGMKPLVLFGLLAGILIRTGVRAQTEEDIAALEEALKDVKLIDFERFMQIVVTDIESEFGTDIEKAKPFYEEAVKYAWGSAFQDLEKKTPFVACFGTDGQVSGGYVKKELRKNLNETGAIQTLINTEQFYCAILMVPAPVALAVGRAEGWFIQPLLPPLKMMKNALGFIEALTEEGYSPVIDVTLCPGADSAQSVMDESIDKALDDTLGKALNWWTDIQDTLGTPPRGEYWDEVLSSGLASDDCKTSIQERLSWTSFESSSNTRIALFFDTDDLGVENSVATVCIIGIFATVMLNPNVCTLEPRLNMETGNLNAQWLTQSYVMNERPFFDAGIYGKGQIVAVSDTGLDVENCYFRDDNVEAPLGSRNEAHRKVIEYKTEDRRQTGFTDYEYGHGTHVAGTVCGSRSSEDPTSGMASGVAPEAKVAFYDIGMENGAVFMKGYDFVRAGRGEEPKASIHSASWGSAREYYSSFASFVDQYIYDNEDLMMFFAAGNEGPDPNTIIEPAACKNGVAVGAVHSFGDGAQRNGDKGPNHVTYFSSQGPTPDGRSKPDVLAPGNWILSAGAQPDNPGACDPSEHPAAGQMADGVASMQGTSMATPITAGTAALIRQYFIDGFYPTGERVPSNSMEPSGALIKAVIMNGGQFVDSIDLGNGGIRHVNAYDSVQNFGRISLADSLYMPGKSNIQAKVWDREVVEDGEKQTYKVTIDKSGGCEASILSVTLTWVEPGAPSGCQICVQNNLDLTVAKKEANEDDLGVSVSEKGNARVYYPNGRPFPDPINNAERVQVSQISDGETYVIEVTATNLEDESQKFALVATGCFGGVANTLDYDLQANQASSAWDHGSSSVVATAVSFIIGGLLFVMI